MGGEVEKERMSEFSWELHLSELKYELKSNIVPIGKIQRGIYYHRALLFKVVIEVYSFRRISKLETANFRFHFKIINE